MSTHTRKSAATPGSSELFAVIMAGGSGTRFWPASRKRLPKQFLAVGGKRSLIAETAERLGKLVPPERRLVVCGEEHAALVRKALRNLPPENILCEPAARNTAPCVAWAALEVERRSKGAVHAVLPADHVIRPAERFRATLAAAADEARASGALVTFGVKPSYPATGYGYIEAGPAVARHGVVPVHAVKRFVEKPDHARAVKFLADGNFFWNSGMFVWTTNAILGAMRKTAPTVIGPLEKAGTTAKILRAYAALPSVSVDVAVLEKAPSVRVIPADFEWSDVGSWPSLDELLPLDAQKNGVAGGALLVAEGSKGCIAYGKRGELVALLGVEDLVVVRAGDVVLVCRKDRAQDVKAIVARLASEGPEFL
jgi:mannose-1-phosphate guanylyltransferase